MPCAINSDARFRKIFACDVNFSDKEKARILGEIRAFLFDRRGGFGDQATI
jgi:hypothetical protein